MEELLTVEAIVHGKVQGVGYRAWTKHTAECLGISGWVQNLADGSVCVVSEGAPEVVKKFLALLEVGPQFAAVTEVVICDRSEKIESHLFEIRR